jgi:hypothetical protein
MDPKPKIKGKVTLELPSQEIREMMRRQIKGALKSCIADHGPVTKNLIGSVLKRLENQPAYRRLLNDNGRET